MYWKIVQEDKEIKGIQIEREEINLPLVTEEMNAYVQNPKALTKIKKYLLGYSRVIRYKINIQKQIVFHVPVTNDWNLKFKKTQYHLH